MFTSIDLFMQKDFTNCIICLFQVIDFSFNNQDQFQPNLSVTNVIQGQEIGFRMNVSNLFGSKLFVKFCTMIRFRDKIVVPVAIRYILCMNLYKGITFTRMLNQSNVVKNKQLITNPWR